MTDLPYYPRFVERRLIEALADTPVVLIHGPRQCGKTTLALVVGEREGYTYLSFDDQVTLAGTIDQLHIRFLFGNFRHETENAHAALPN